MFSAAITAPTFAKSLVLVCGAILAPGTRTVSAVGLGERLHHLPAQLSGGEQQRVCIARVLINQPKIILADEPTGNLDAANEEIVLDIFRRLHAQGHTLIVVTHDARVGRLADRLIALEHGHVVQAESNEHEPRQRAAPPMPVPEPEGGLRRLLCA